jgi:transcriptional regulator with XRE-family HTH domain
LATLRRNFGQRLRQIRHDLKQTQEEFAEMLGLSVDFLSLIERGRNAPSFEKLEVMAKGLGKPVAYLFAFGSTDSEPQEKKASSRNRRVK